MKMKLLMENWNKFLVSEMASLSRTWEHIQEHDCAVITGYRGDPTDNSKCAVGSRTDTGTDYLKINQERNAELIHNLRSLGYGVTSVAGSYIEDYLQDTAKEVKEASLFVVNLNDDPSFVSQVENLGQYLCQDSVLIIPQGGEEAYLLGTNNADFPGFGNQETVGSFHAGSEEQFMTKVKSRPFSFKENKIK